MKFGFGIVGIPRRGGGPLVKPAPGAIIDPQHPLAQGLECMHPLNDSSGLVAMDYAKGNHGTIVGMSWQTIGGWSGLRSTTVTQYVQHYLPSFSGSVCTTIMGITPFAAGASGPPVWGSDGIYTYHQLRTSTGVRALKSDVAVSSYSLTSGTRRLWVFRAGGNPNIAVFVDGKLDGSSASAVTDVKPSVAVTYGSFYSNAAYYIDGLFDYYAFYSRALSQTEIAQLHASPYQMFWLPGARKIFVGTAARLQSYRDYVSISKYNLNGDKIILRKYDPTKSNDMIVLR